MTALERRPPAMMAANCHRAAFAISSRPPRGLFQPVSAKKKEVLGTSTSFSQRTTHRKVRFRHRMKQTLNDAAKPSARRKPKSVASHTSSCSTLIANELVPLSFPISFPVREVNLCASLYQLCTHFRIKIVVPCTSEKSNRVQFSRL